MGDDGKLRREALHMLGLFLEEAHRDEEREVSILVSRLLKTTVESVLQVLPQGKAVRAQDYIAPHRCVVDQLGLQDHIGVPTGIVLVSGCNFFGHNARLTPP